MPASQLKRLKASLRDQGITGPQKSKKQKKQQQGQQKSDRHAALQQIRDSFNPFELKAISARPEKFTSANINSNGGGGKYKQVLHRPGVSRSAGEEMRRNTLLPELRRRNKVGGLIDRRIGEGDVDMTPEEKAAQRFAREKERKTKGKSLFDLEGSDGEDAEDAFGLTHGGRRLGELAVDDFGEMSGGDESEDDHEQFLTRKRPRSDVEEDEGEEENDVSAEEGQHPERKKTKKEVMEEVIAKSKMHKYERQKIKEDDDDLRMELDQGMADIMSMLQGVKKPAPKQSEASLANGSGTNGNGPTVNPDRQRLLDGMDRTRADKEYDVRLKQLANDARAKPSERTKTAEEKAEDEAQRLRELEERRQRRMRGEDVSDAEPDADAVIDEDIPDQAAEFGFTSFIAQSKRATSQLVLDDEDEFALDDELVADESEIEDVELSDEISEISDDESEGEREYTSRAQPRADEEDEFVKDILGPDVIPPKSAANTVDAPGLAYTYPCPRSHSELLDIVKDLPPEQLPTVIQRIRKLYHPSLSAANKECMADFSRALVDHLMYMAETRQPLAMTEQVIRHLHSLSRTYPSQIGERFREKLAASCERAQLSAGDLTILTAIGSIYPTSDHWHQVVTPAITLMARWLGLNAPSPGKPVERKTLTTGSFLVALCMEYQHISERYIPEAVRFTLRALACGQEDKALITVSLTNLIAMADLWKDKTAFIEIARPALPILKSLSAKREHHHLTILLRQAHLRRRPLELHHHRPLPLRTSVPKFEENFNPDKHYDPDKERSDLKKLEKEHKRERKGALRELRKDANFIAREQLREKKIRDDEQKKKERRLIAEIQAEEGREANEYAREKRKRTGK